MNPLVVQGAAQLLLGKYKSQKGMLMKNLLTMAATGLVIFAGLGWYLDWYKVARTSNPDGTKRIVIDVNTKRIEGDIEKGRDYLQNTAFGSQGQTPQSYQNPASPPPYSSPAPPAPNPGSFPQQPAFPQPGFQQPFQPPFQQPSQQPWAPTAPVNRPNTGNFTPGQPAYAPPPNIPGRPF
jgi:hypothetical protein